MSINLNETLDSKGRVVMTLSRSLLLPRTSYQIHVLKIAGCAYAGNAGNAFHATACKRSRHASWHVRHARAVMHNGIAYPRLPFEVGDGENVPGISGACATRNFMCLVWGPCRCDFASMQWNYELRNITSHNRWMRYGFLFEILDRPSTMHKIICTTWLKCQI